MDISQTTASPVTYSGAESQTQQADPSGKAVLSSDFETFIKMLTTQMTNQDPLNPMDSADFATQLATFSSVEQQVKTNDLLGALNTQMGVMNLSQLTGWVGMEARAVVPVVYDGEPVKLTLEGAATADRHQLVVRDGNENVVQRLDLATGKRQEMTWDGTDSFGNPVSKGTYSIDVESYTQSDLVKTTPVEVHGKVVEARLDGTQTRLVLENGQEVGSALVLGLRKAG